MYKLLLLNILLFTSFVESKITKIMSSSLIASAQLGEVNLFHSSYGKFFITQDGKLRAIENYNIDECLRSLKSEQIDRLQEVAIFTVSQLSDGELRLSGNVKGLGGGPLTGALMMWIVRAVCYVPPAAVGTAATIASAGGAGPVVAGTAASVGVPYIATVEGFATGAGLLFASQPWCP